MRRELLYASYDIKAKFEADGWTCDVTYFMNMSSPQDTGLSIREELRNRHGGGIAGIDLRANLYGSTEEIERIPITALRSNALATGACFVALADFDLDELVSIEMGPEDTAVEAARSALVRSRILQYFSSPIDELMLAALSQPRVEWSESELALVPSVSKRLKHPVSAASVLEGVDKNDPLRVAEALRREKFIQYEGRRRMLRKKERRLLTE